VAGFDIIYALQDLDFDRREGLKSIPARWGVEGALAAARASHALTVILLAVTWRLLGLGPVFLAGVAVIAGLLAHEHALVKPGDLRRLGVAFFNVNGAVSVLLFIFTLADLYLVSG